LVERMCCVCRTRKSVGEMVRVGKLSVGVFEINTKNGRGCYFCPSCVDVVVKKRVLNKSFKCNVPNEVYEKINLASSK
jgi:hypothetical protein